MVGSPSASSTHARRRRWLRSNTILTSGVIALAAGLAVSASPVNAQSIWSGTTSNDWYTPSNWGIDGVPDEFHDAVISTDSPNKTVIDGLGPGNLGARADDLHLGSVDFSTGNLTIQNGGKLTTFSGLLGVSATGIGLVKVTGPGSAWNVDNISVGDNGSGQLDIVNGATTTSQILLIGAQAGSTGFVNVRGAGSTLTVFDALNVGNVGSGHLTIGDGGTVASDFPISVGTGAFGILSIGGHFDDTATAPGTINAPSVDLASATNSGLAFNHTSNNYTFAPRITGSGVVVVQSGTTILTANNTYTGETRIGGGRLFVNGSIVSATTVESGGTLGGNGTVGNNVVVKSGGTLAPGPIGAPGGLVINGNLAFESGANYLVQVAGGTASDITGAGTATLAGTVQAQFAPGSAIPKTHNILAALNGLGGTTFDGVTSNNPNLGVSLSYDEHSVFLNVTAMLGAAGGLAQNQQNVANVINDAFNAGTLPPGFNSLLGLSGSSLSQALSQTSGEVATGSQQGAFQLMNQFLGVMLDPFVYGRGGVPDAGGTALGYVPERPLPPELAGVYAADLGVAPVKAPIPVVYAPRWAVWGAAYGGQNRTNGDPAQVGSHDLTARAGGVAAGVDYRVGGGTTVGFALAGGGTDWRLTDALGKGRSDAFQAGFYSTTRMGPAYLAAALAYANHWMSTDRTAFAGDQLTAKFNGQSFGGRVEGGWRIAVLSGGFTPYAAGQGQALRTPSYVETDITNGGFALSYQARNATAIRSELGARFDQAFAIAPGAAFGLFGRVAWAHDWVSDPTLNPVFQGIPGGGFIVNGATPAKNLALASAGAELKLANFAIAAKFDGEFASGSSTYAGTGTVRVMW